MCSNCNVIKDNFLGFTEETDIVLQGLGCKDTIEFKKRNISLVDLEYLTKEDMITLGVGDGFDFDSFDKLHHVCETAEKNDSRLEIDTIVQQAEIEIKYIKYFLVYIYKRSLEAASDYFFEEVSNLKTSQVLKEASIANMQEIKDLYSALQSLKV